MEFILIFQLKKNMKAIEQLEKKMVKIYYIKKLYF